MSIPAVNVAYLWQAVVNPRRGTKYVWGGSFNKSDPAIGTDCSGAVSACLGALADGANMTYARQFWTGTFMGAQPGSTGPYGGVSETADLACVASPKDAPADAAMIIAIAQTAQADTSHMICQVGGVTIECGGSSNNFHTSLSDPSCSKITDPMFNQWFYLPGPTVDEPTSLFGVDISNVNDNSSNTVNLTEIVAEGFSWIEAKVSQGSGFRDADWPRTRNYCTTNEIPLIGYHYLDSSDPVAQAQNCLTWLGDKTIPVMIDMEAGSGPITNAIAFASAITSLGGTVKFTYLPRWYWQQIGEPRITLPNVISSAYPGGAGYASSIYQSAGGATGTGWTPYGGQQPVIWQFTDQAAVAGLTLDADAYQGTVAGLNDMIDTTTRAPQTPAAPALPPAPSVLSIVTDIDTQLRGPGLKGWPQLGADDAGNDLTLVDAVAAIKTILEQKGAPVTDHLEETAAPRRALLSGNAGFFGALATFLGSLAANTASGDASATSAWAYVAGALGATVTAVAAYLSAHPAPKGLLGKLIRK